MVRAGLLWTRPNAEQAKIVFLMANEHCLGTKTAQGMQEELGQRCTVRQLQGGAKEATAIPSCYPGRLVGQPPGGTHPSPCVRHHQERS